MKFFSPTGELKELLLLQHIEKTPDTTQKEIAQVIGGAPSMVNVYIDNLEEKNYMARDYQSPKIVYYNITPEGVKRKNFLAITYFHELLELYRLAEENIENFLVGLEDKDYEHILVYGAGEVAETILGIISGRVNKALKVLALIDDDEERQGKELLGYKIISREEIKDYKHDGIVITSYTFEDDITKRLKEINYPEDRIERFFTE
ncbi:MAG TPA: winged helix-turn-helix transcriptional regulator [Tissierellaceae bacterium]|nr:winged helix-turn-helix transcriptional regulator [Tissierellaceae bacterium]